MSAVASASPLINTTYWVGFGEKDPDEFGQLPGTRLQIVLHDGTVKGLVRVLEEIASLYVPKDGANLIVVDSGSRIWGTVGDEVREGKRSGDAQTGDLWTDGKGDWQAMLNALRRHHGPSIITARLEETIIHDEGRPTKDRSYRTKAEKDIAYDVDIVIEMRSRGQFLLTKANSEAMRFTGSRQLPEDYSMDTLWREMDLGDGVIGERSYALPVVQLVDSLDKTGRDWITEIDNCVSLAQVQEIGAAATVAKADAGVMTAVRSKLRRLTPSAEKQPSK
jgi:hypothetical protein